MGAFLVILFIFGLVAGIEIPGIIKKKQWHEMAAFIVLLSAGFAITTMKYVFNFDFSIFTVWLIKVFGLW